MKGVVRSLILGSAAAMILAAAPAWAELKIGYVNYSALLQESPDAKTIADALRNEFLPRQRELQTLQQSLKAAFSGNILPGGKAISQQGSTANSSHVPATVELQALEPVATMGASAQQNSSARSVLSAKSSVAAARQQLAAAHTFDAPIVTQVATAMPFYPAEAYHQNFAVLHPDNPYIAQIDAPKVTALAQLFPMLYRANPTQVRVSWND